ncbi:MAG: ABC transporter substrate-binding protein [Haloquadratum sp.]|nr:ABC transporter substrate-binding protein [Haloferacaceae archaeon]MDR9445075.1 ABC transporter substrate-binding protein [Haloquadratum sp.]
MQRRRFITAATAAAGMGLLAGCTGGDGDAAGADPLTIGVLVPFSGDYAWVGANVLPAVQMVAEQVNEAGGIGGRQLRVVQGDTEALPDASLSATQQLISVEEVAGIIGPTSLTYSAVADLFVENGVPTVTPTAGTTTLDTQGGEYVYRTVPSDSIGGRAIAAAAREERINGVGSFGSMALMVGQREVYQSFKQPIGSSFTEFGGEVVSELDFRTGKASYESEVQALTEAAPEITALVASIEDSVKIMEAAYQAGYEGSWFLTQDQTNVDFLSQSEAVVTDGALGIQEAPYEAAQADGRAAAFDAAIQEYAGWEETRLFATNAYDAANLLFLAMHKGQVDNGAVDRASTAANVRAVASPDGTVVTDFDSGAAAISEGTAVDYRGLVGPIDFNEFGDIAAPFSIRRAEGDRWVEAGRVRPADL